MDRETRTFNTPVESHTVEIKTYLVGREKRALQNIFLGKNISVSLDANNFSGIDASAIEAAQELAWKTVIVSIDGHKDGETVNEKIFSIVDTVLDMRSEDYNTVVAEVNSLTSEKKS